MRHGVKNKKLGVNAQHKRAILRSLATSILEKGLETEQGNRYIRTTLLKAKLAKSIVDRLITYAKKGDLSARREAARFVRDPKVVQGLFDVLGPRYASRNGGYTRVLKLGPNRPGDAAEMALIGLVEDEVVEKTVKPSQKKAEVKPIDMVEGAAKTAE
jgi:large subunit ribosomal protein L17